jgi:hypothetical protein
MPAEALPMCRQFDESSCCSRCARFDAGCGRGSRGGVARVAVPGCYLW